MLVDQRGGLEAVHARHAHIQQDDGKVVLHELLERIHAGAGRDQVLAQLCQDDLVGEQARRLVVDEQHVHFFLRLAMPPCTITDAAICAADASSCSVSTGLAM